MGQIAENGENGQDGHILVYFAQKIHQFWNLNQVNEGDV